MRRGLKSLLWFVGLSGCFVWGWFFISSFDLDLPGISKPIKFYAFETQDDLQRVLIKTINQAHESIDLIIFSLTDPDVIQALHGRLKAGCRLRLLIDAQARVPEELGGARGGELKILRYPSKGLMHIKLLAVDGKNVLLGSANYTFESLKVHHNLMIGVRDSHLASHVEELLTSLAYGQTKVNSMGNVLSGERFEMWTDLTGEEAVSRIEGAIDRATRSVRIALFTWTREDLAEALIRAYQRGVEVEIFLDRQQSRRTNRKVVDQLMAAGIPVRMSRGRLLHHKLMVVDDRLLITGSANWTEAACSKNEEILFVLHDLKKSQRDFFHRLWKYLRVSCENEQREICNRSQKLIFQERKSGYITGG